MGKGKTDFFKVELVFKSLKLVFNVFKVSPNIDIITKKKKVLIKIYFTVLQTSLSVSIKIKYEKSE